MGEKNKQKKAQKVQKKGFFLLSIFYGTVGNYLKTKFKYKSRNIFINKAPPLCFGLEAAVVPPWQQREWSVVGVMEVFSDPLSRRPAPPGENGL